MAAEEDERDLVTCLARELGRSYGTQRGRAGLAQQSGVIDLTRSDQGPIDLTGGDYMDDESFERLQLHLLEQPFEGIQNGNRIDLVKDEEDEGMEEIDDMDINWSDSDEVGRVLGSFGSDDEVDEDDEESDSDEKRPLRRHSARGTASRGRGGRGQGRGGSGVSNSQHDLTASRSYLFG